MSASIREEDEIVFTMPSGNIYSGTVTETWTEDDGAWVRVAIDDTSFSLPIPVRSIVEINGEATDL